jgi:hypothetical protein
MHVRNAYPVSMYIAGKSRTEQPGDRLIHLVWKSNTKEGRVAHSSRCLSVPMWQPLLTGEDTAFLDMLRDAFEDRQNKIAHRYATMMLDSNGGVCNDIPAEYLAAETVLADFIEEQERDSTRGKLSGDQIKEWFEVTLRPLIEAKIAENNGWMEAGFQMTTEHEKKVRQVASGYRATMEKLAAPKPNMEIKTAKQLMKAVDLLPTIQNDPVGMKLKGKIDRILNPPAEEAITLADL